MIQRFTRFFLFFLFFVLMNVCVMTYLENEVQRRNCFPYETAFENFRNEEVTEDVVNLFLYEKGEIEPEKFSDYLTMYFALDNTCTDKKQLDKNIDFVKEYQPDDFSDIQEKINAMWTDAILFPVGEISNQPDMDVSFSNSWKQSRTFGGERFHEGCDIMANVNERGIYPIYSVSDGVIEKIGWLKLGGWRIGVRSEHGVYFYYAHLAEYAREFEIGEEISAGTLLGFMGDTGYSQIEGTTGNFPVHLHFGIYFNDENGNEYSVNPYPLLRYLNVVKYEKSPAVSQV